MATGGLSVIDALGLECHNTASGRGPLACGKLTKRLASHGVTMIPSLLWEGFDSYSTPSRAPVADPTSTGRLIGRRCVESSREGVFTKPSHCDRLQCAQLRVTLKTVCNVRATVRTYSRYYAGLSTSATVACGGLAPGRPCRTASDGALPSRPRPPRRACRPQAALRTAIRGGRRGRRRRPTAARSFEACACAAPPAGGARRPRRATRRGATPARRPAEMATGTHLLRVGSQVIVRVWLGFGLGSGEAGELTGMAVR